MSAKLLIALAGMIGCSTKSDVATTSAVPTKRASAPTPAKAPLNLCALASEIDEAFGDSFEPKPASVDEGSDECTYSAANRSLIVSVQTITAPEYIAVLEDQLKAEELRPVEGIPDAAYFGRGWLTAIIARKGSTTLVVRVMLGGGSEAPDIDTKIATGEKSLAITVLAKL